MLEKLRSVKWSHIALDPNDALLNVILGSVTPLGNVTPLGSVTPLGNYHVFFRNKMKNNILLQVEKILTNIFR